MKIILPLTSINEKLSSYFSWILPFLIHSWNHRDLIKYPHPQQYPHHYKKIKLQPFPLSYIKITGFFSINVCYTFYLVNGLVIENAKCDIFNKNGKCLSWLFTSIISYFAIFDSWFMICFINWTLDVSLGTFVVI